MIENETTEENNIFVKENNISSDIKHLSVGGVAISIAEDFKKLAKNRKITQSQLFTTIFSSYRNLPLEFNETEGVLIQEAYSLAAETLDKKIKKMVLRYAQSAIDSKDKTKPKPKLNIKNKNSAEAADTRADNLIEQIIKQNDEAGNWYDKMMITKKSIFDYAKAQKQADANNISMGKVVIERCLERNRELIDLHHQEHKLVEGHNVAAYYERLKLSKEAKV